MPLLKDNVAPWNRKTIIFVHGIGVQPAGYSEPLYNILRAEDPVEADATRWYEVAYDAINDAMAKKLDQQTKTGVPPADPNDPDAMKTALNFTFDLVNFLFSVDPYHWITNYFKSELTAVVDRALQDDVYSPDHQVTIISHSLGTVVSYELLHAIIDMPQVLGSAKGFRIKTLFTLGSPIAFIKANAGKIPTLNPGAALRSKPIGRPVRLTRTGREETNVLDWYNLQQDLDPVTAITPLTMESTNGALSQETLRFKEFHEGVNPHGFDNYLTEFSPFIWEKIRA